MKEVEIPGGTASFRERGKDEITGRAVKLIRAAALSGMSLLAADHPEVLQAARSGESEEMWAARLDSELRGVSLSTEQAMAIDNMKEAVVVALLASWTLERPLPTLATIGDLDEELYTALLDAVDGMTGAALTENFDPGNPKAPGFKESPTTGSNGSVGPSEEAPLSRSTRKSRSDGENSVTAKPSPV